MENCLLTRLKGTIDNDSLEILGCIKIKHTDVSGKTGKLRINNNATGKNIVVSVDGTGSFSVDGTSYTEYTVAATKHPQFVFSRGNYNIYINNKYDVESIDSEGDFEPFVNAGLSFEKLGCMPKLQSIQVSKWANGFMGNVEDFDAPLIRVLNINGTSAKGDIKEIGKFANLDKLSLYPSNIHGELFDFISKQNSVGRTSVADDKPISWNNISQNATLNGVVLYGDRGLLTFKVTNNVIEKATVYLRGATITASTIVYCYGATESEITAWRDSGKTVTTV